MKSITNCVFVLIVLIIIMTACTLGHRYNQYDPYSPDAAEIYTPDGLSAGDGSYSDKIKVQWNQVNNAVSYNVYRSESATEDFTFIKNVQNNIYEDDSTAVEVNKIYYYKVTAELDSGTETEYSNVDSGYKTNKQVIVDIDSADLTSDLTPDWSWNPVKNGIMYYYELYENSDLIDEGTIEPDVIYDTTEDLQNNYITYNPEDTIGELWDSDFILQVSCEYRTGEISNIDTKKLTVYTETPSGLSASQGQADGIRITWDRMTYAKSYIVYRSESLDALDADFEEIGTTTTQYYVDDDNIIEYIDYYYKVKAVLNNDHTTDFGYFTDEKGMKHDWIVNGFKALKDGLDFTGSEGTYTDLIELTWNWINRPAPSHFTATQWAHSDFDSIRSTLSTYYQQDPNDLKYWLIDVTDDAQYDTMEETIRNTLDGITYDKYEILRSSARQDTWISIGTVSVNETYFADESADPGVRYDYTLALRRGTEPKKMNVIANGFKKFEAPTLWHGNEMPNYYTNLPEFEYIMILESIGKPQDRQAFIDGYTKTGDRYVLKGTLDDTQKSIIWNIIIQQGENGIEGGYFDNPLTITIKSGLTGTPPLYLEVTNDETYLPDEHVNYHVLHNGTEATSDTVSLYINRPTNLLTVTGTIEEDTSEVRSADFIIFTMIPVDGGNFEMGLPDATTDATVGNFFISNVEITSSKWYEVKDWAELNGYTFNDEDLQGYNDWGEDDEPITQVNFYDALAWCNAYTEYDSAIANTEVCYTTNGTTTYKDATNTTVIFTSTKNGYRLPTEQEWEYAARYVYPDEFTEGDDFSGGINIDLLGWCKYNAGAKTHGVTRKKANKLGLYDMSGNVSEWCWTDETADNIVLRGGSWNDEIAACRTAARDEKTSVYVDGFPYADESNTWGFRIARNRP